MRWAKIRCSAQSKASSPKVHRFPRHTLVLFKAQLGEPFLEMLIFLLSGKTDTEVPKTALNWAKPALKRPNWHFNKKRHLKLALNRGSR